MPYLLLGITMAIEFWQEILLLQWYVWMYPSSPWATT